MRVIFCKICPQLSGSLSVLLCSECLNSTVRKVFRILRYHKAVLAAATSVQSGLMCLENIIREAFEQRHATSKKPWSALKSCVTHPVWFGYQIILSVGCDALWILWGQRYTVTWRLCIVWTGKPFDIIITVATLKRKVNKAMSKG